MPRHLDRRIHRIASAAATVLLLAVSTGGASAQGLLDFLFGGGRRSTPAYVAPNAYADPFGIVPGVPRREYSGGGGTAFCVRTCDGRYFPLQRHANTSPAELCKSFCPSSKTMVFSGSKIDHAVASNGTRYADLDNAFAYRDRVVNNCTCNGKDASGKDALGLARVDLAEDPTLRPGDIVATNEGLATFRGKSGSKAAEYTPINASASEWARRLAEVKVRPAPPPPKVTPVAEDSSKPARKERRSVHLAR